MFVIVDTNNIVQDVATEKANLSRGLTLDGYTLYENVAVTDIQVGDTFDGKVVTPNLTAQAERQRRGLQRRIVEAMLKQKAAVKSGFMDLASEYTAEVARCQDELATLSN